METYTAALFGGLAMGLGGAILLLINGRVLGVSGILNGLTAIRPATPRLENFAFLLGLMAAPGILARSDGNLETNSSDSLLLLAFAGLLIGVGASMANGCTSGHSISGASRFSGRSFVASILYLLVAATAYATLHHGMGYNL